MFLFHLGLQVPELSFTVNQDILSLNVSWSLPPQPIENMHEYVVQYKQVGLPPTQGFDWIIVHQNHTSVILRGLCGLNWSMIPFLSEHIYWYFVMFQSGFKMTAWLLSLSPPTGDFENHTAYNVSLFAVFINSSCLLASAISYSLHGRKYIRAWKYKSL